MSEGNLLKLRLSLMGRPVRNYTFDKPVISIGRDPGSDVFVDNPGVSRDHFRLEKTPAGEYQLVDLGSANGTFVNDQMVHTAVVKNNDVVRFGKYTLWVGYDTDRRAGAQESRRSSAGAEQHTMILSRAELGNLLEVSKEREVHPVAPPAGVSQPAGAVSPSVAVHSAPAPVAAIVVSFLLGAALGAGAVWLLLSR
jgi:pSer/pThr/pTyr-binding forkhead associated (FHA) protein